MRDCSQSGTASPKISAKHGSLQPTYGPSKNGALSGHTASRAIVEFVPAKMHTSALLSPERPKEQCYRCSSSTRSLSCFPSFPSAVQLFLPPEFTTTSTWHHTFK